MVLDDQTWVELGSYEVGTSPPPHVPALSQIGAGDRVIIEGSAYASGGERRRAYQRRIISENPGTYVLPAHLGGMATATETSWEGDWDFVTFAASYESQATGPTMYVTGLELTISKAAGAGNSIPHFDPRTLPGWNVAWAPPPTWVGGEVRAWRGDPLGEMWSAATAVSSPL